jgi:transposase
VDDWAWRKGQRYGTILIDLERHVPIDLLPDRSAESLEAWLKAHPGVEVISRDRAGNYADGVNQGAPEAVQVADRFHLLCNLTSAVQRSLEPQRALLRTIASEGSPAPTMPPAPELPLPKTRSQQRKDEHRAHRLDRYSQVIELHRHGMSQREIGRQLHLDRKTVRRFLLAGRFPERSAPHRHPPRVNAFRDYLQQRWNEGCHNATQLWHEIQGRGYDGGRRMVSELVSEFRTSGAKYSRQLGVQPKVKHRDLSPRQAAMLMARRSEDLSAEQQCLLAKLTEASPEIAAMHDLVGEFRTLLRGRREEDLVKWTDHAISSGLPEMQRFCETLRRDQSAILAAIRLPWSNGQVEGQVHRLKLIKRQMYGRAGFLLLKRRVLPPCARSDGLSR